MKLKRLKIIAFAIGIAATSSELSAATKVDARLHGALMALRAGCSECPEFVEVVDRAGGHQLAVSTTEITFRQYRAAMMDAKCPAPFAVRQKKPISFSDMPPLSHDDPSLDTEFPVTGINAPQIECYVTWLNTKLFGVTAAIPSVSDFYLYARLDIDQYLRGGPSIKNERRFLLPGIPSSQSLPLMTGDDVIMRLVLPREVRSTKPNSDGVFGTIGNAAEITSTCVAGPIAIQSTEGCHWRAVCGGSIAFPPATRVARSDDAAIPNMCERESGRGNGSFMAWIGFRVVVKMTD